jgi:hypothetical protein
MYYNYSLLPLNINQILKLMRGSELTWKEVDKNTKNIYKSSTKYCRFSCVARWYSTKVM